MNISFKSSRKTFSDIEVLREINCRPVLYKALQVKHVLQHGNLYLLKEMNIPGNNNCVCNYKVSLRTSV